MNIDVNYKNKKRYKTAKYPIRQPIALTWLISALCKIDLMGKKYKVEKINMEGLKPPYMMLSNHMHFIDFKLAALGTFPYRVNNVVSIDGFYRRPWLLELIGAICTRKFTMDLHLVKSINKVLKRGDILSMYPEARYSPCGVTSYMPEALGKLIKMNKCPVVVVVHRGNHLRAPFWNWRDKRNVPHHTTMTQILTADQVKAMSVDEINKAVRDAMQYDDYQYQKDNNILIKSNVRAEGLHKVLYKCPHCMAEEMSSEGSDIFCKKCGKRWTWHDNGYLEAAEGETEFDHIPDWFEWERLQVRKEVESGEYSFSDEVDVYSFPRCWKFEPLGKARLTHDVNNGFIIDGFYNGEKYHIQREPSQINSLHVEYDYAYLKNQDVYDISTENDSFYCYSTKPNVLTKLAFATEEIYRVNMEKVKESKSLSRSKQGQEK